MENHLEMGKKLLAAGQLADALSHFHAAVGELAKGFYTQKNPTVYIYITFTLYTLYIYIKICCMSAQILHLCSQHLTDIFIQSDLNYRAIDN